MSRLLPIAHFIAEQKEIPDNARRAARYQVLNMIAATHAAFDDKDAIAIEQANARLSGQGKSTVLFSRRRTDPANAASVNAAFSMAHDFDDIIWMGHTCHSAVFASLAVAEHEGATPEAFIDAVVIANEVAGRLGASSFLGALNGQMMTYIHLVGAAAATARLLRLNAARTAQALAIALSQPTFPLPPAFMASSSKLWCASPSIAQGINAAYMAERGITGHLDILEDERGFWNRFSFIPLAEMLGDLGTFWATETLAVKTFPGCHYFQTACTAIERIAEKRRLHIDDVQSVALHSNKLTCEVTHFGSSYGGEKLTPVNVNFDATATLAVWLTAGRLTTHELTGAWLHENHARIHAWKNKISIAHDPALTLRVLASARHLPAGARALASLGFKQWRTLYRRYRENYASQMVSPKEIVAWVRAVLAAKTPPEKIQGSAIPLAFPSRVRVTFKDGTSEEWQVDVPVASFCFADMEKHLREKFMAAVTPRLGLAAAETLYAKGCDGLLEG